MGMYKIFTKKGHHMVGEFLGVFKGKKMYKVIAETDDLVQAEVYLLALQPTVVRMKAKVS